MIDTVLSETVQALRTHLTLIPNIHHRNPARQTMTVPISVKEAMGTTRIQFKFKKMGLECTFEENTLQRASAGLFILTIVQLLLFLVLTVSWRIHMEPPPLESSMHCLPCDDITQTFPYNDTENIIDAWRQIYNDSVCCGPIREVLEFRIQNEMTKQHVGIEQANPSLLVGEVFITDCEWQGIKVPTAKLVGVVDSVPSGLVQGHSKLLWNKNSPTFIANRCIYLVVEGEIFIEKPGYYILSSTLNVNTTGTNNTTTFSHSLNLLSDKFGKTGVLMKRKRSIKKSDDSVFTSFLSAVFKLHVYDRISVSVSDPNRLAENFSYDHFTAYYTYEMV